ncbi:prevent-host-death family protein [Streptomyces sp. MUM 203J]|uniref:prevent-host-death family protein n=1 Tax=Streptomyces sp. MUM 203J TaxID=2791990 RepID=UPI001F033B47|nr:prevent-host-death family protein [Streptomyces sp. MUM 203J]MCH0540162.1 prevent-host-death family protein [Streptomyces sp. MUM 203J]
MTTIEEVTFSDLSRHARDVAAKLKGAERLRITRRDGGDLILTTAEREERREEAVATIARTFAALIKSDEGARALLLALPETFPWVRHLDPEEVQEFLVEIVQAVRDAADIDVYGPLSGIVAAWKATARIKADPELHRDLTSPLDATDYGVVAAP